MKSMNIDEVLLTYAETAELLGVKRVTLYSMVSRHELPHVRLGPRLVRFRRSELAAWIAKCAVPAADGNSEEEQP